MSGMGSRTRIVKPVKQAIVQKGYARSILSKTIIFIAGVLVDLKGGASGSSIFNVNCRAISYLDIMMSPMYFIPAIYPGRQG